MNKDKRVICKKCHRGNYIYPGETNKIKYLYNDNILVYKECRCPYCETRYYYFSHNNVEDIIFLDESVNKYINLNFKNLYVSYVPIPSLKDENRKIIESVKEKKDFTIGFDGWEDIVLDKKLAGEWYLTANPPPRLDLEVYTICTSMRHAPDVYYSYFPSPMLESVGIKPYIMDGRDIKFFDERKKELFSKNMDIYIGTRS